MAEDRNEVMRSRMKRHMMAQRARSGYRFRDPEGVSQRYRRRPNRPPQDAIGEPISATRPVDIIGEPARATRPATDIGEPATASRGRSVDRRAPFARPRDRAHP